MAFVTAQRRPKPGSENVVRIDGSAGLSAATIKRRLAAVSSFYGYLVTRDDVAVTANPVPRGIATRQSRSRGGRGLPLVRGVRRLPRILDPSEIDALMGALRTERDRAMTQAMVLGRSPSLRGARASPGRSGARRMAGADQRGQGRTRASGPAVADLLCHRGPLHGPRATGRRRRATPSSSPSKVRIGASRSRCPASTRSSGPPGERAGLSHGTCHELRHTCFTRLREAGMAIEAIQAQAGHRSITSTRVYLHLSVDWLADEYRRASEAIEAQALVGVAQ